MGEGNNTILHKAGKDSEIDRQVFDREKSDYWKARFKAFTPSELKEIYSKWMIIRYLHTLVPAAKPKSNYSHFQRERWQTPRQPKHGFSWLSVALHVVERCWFGQGFGRWWSDVLVLSWFLEQIIHRHQHLNLSEILIVGQAVSCYQCKMYVAILG